VNKIVIIPTGNEVQDGIVVDTNSPAMMEIVLGQYPRSTVLRVAPIGDNVGEIQHEILSYKDSDLVLVIGGSGGGRKFDPSLAVDATHEALENLLADVCIKEIYGCNGHLWSRLVIGKCGNALVANVPGPYREAVAATKALIESVSRGLDLKKVSNAVTEAVVAQYSSACSVK
jgi:molybdopterin biosynthesis enzyme